MSLRFVNYGYGDGGRIEYGTVPHVGGERRYNKSKDCRPPRREVPAGKGQRRRSLTNRCGTSIVTTCLILLCTVQGVRASHGGDEVLILNGLASSPTLRQMIVEKDPYIAADGAVERNAFELDVYQACGSLLAIAIEFEHVAHQRHAIWRLWQDPADEALQAPVSDAMLYAFDWQDKTYGYFLNGLGAPLSKSLEADVFFLAAHGHIALLLDEVQSPYGLADLNPDYSLGMDWLKLNIKAISNEGRKRTNVLWFAAQAFLLASVELERSDLWSLGVALGAQAIRQQSLAGWFAEYGGWDSSYNAVSMLHMAIIWAHIPDGSERAALYNSLARSAAWQKSRILPTGKVKAAGNTRTGPQHCKQINYPEVAMALFYWAIAAGDSDAFDKAELVAAYYLANRQES